MGAVMGYVLIVDDQESIRELYQIFAIREGYECEVASNGREALDICDKRVPTLVITDIEMPVMNGLVMMKELGQSYPQVKIVAVSGSGDGRLTEALELGAVATFEKPLNPAVMMKKISNFVA
jgi:DNA-binding NtrC family response regulator